MEQTITEKRPINITHPGISNGLVMLMAITCGLVVANIYYNQPLLVQIAETFHLTINQVSIIATITQVGYTLGLLFIVPLGDKTERRKLILVKTFGAAICMIAAAFSANFYMLVAASLFVGIFSSVPQLLLPMAATMAPATSRGKIVGKVMSGLLIGILLSRTLSGFIGAHLGWRAVFLIGGLATAGLLAILSVKLPKNPPTFEGSYASLMKSLITLTKEMPTLRQAAITGFCMFGAFSVFWTTLVFLLEGSPFFFKSDMVGMFGVIGACGALAAPLAGKSSDKKGPHFTILLGIIAAIVAYVIMGFSGTSLIGLIAGVILLDVGMQVTHISNQSKVFALNPEARSRLNTVYISSSFAGGSLGSLLGARAWSAYGWPGVCVLGTSIILFAFLINIKKSKQ
ncbi:Predicted arabinose efflux permease, MFS family [Chitinophaga jiangningensis]|uniref:Predicted arabinose efflux permease, MFS family n=1 Tax=Chitinophaga jiangningensis TaxID=1419482 RepID=A0A1M7MJW0_9BACT|nr:MFS transporter [Chitinophaga jiangningensis]SHM91166.1 Predicted arabinose efflux permease, MFS family [Chitinophaga jiangningensis]